MADGDARWTGRLARRGAAAAGAVRAARDRVRDNLWPVLQSTAAATTAWLIALHLVDHHQPFFAPIAAVIGLNAARGSRGAQATRLLVGAVVGIAVAEVVLHLAAGGYGTLAIAVFAAMMLAVAINAQRIVIGQAAAGAILTIVFGHPEAGVQRLADALIGAGGALVFSQLLFPAEPIALVRRAETAALREMAGGLELTVRALEHGDPETAHQAIERMRGAGSLLVDLVGTRRRSHRYVRSTPLWWRRAALVARESQEAERIELLGGTCFMIARTVLVADDADRAALVPPVRELAEAMTVLAEAPDDLETRRRAAYRGLALVRRLTGGYSPLTTGRTLVRLAATDLLLFTGVDEETAGGTRRADAERLRVRDPPPASPVPLASRRWGWRQGRRSRRR